VANKYLNWNSTESGVVMISSIYRAAAINPDSFQMIEKALNIRFFIFQTLNLASRL